MAVYRQSRGRFELTDATDFLERICYNLAKTISQTHRERPVLPTLSVL